MKIRVLWLAMVVVAAVSGEARATSCSSDVVPPPFIRFDGVVVAVEPGVPNEHRQEVTFDTERVFVNGQLPGEPGPAEGIVVLAAYVRPPAQVAGELTFEVGQTWRIQASVTDDGYYTGWCHGELMLRDADGNSTGNEPDGGCRIGGRATTPWPLLFVAAALVQRHTTRRSRRSTHRLGQCAVAEQAAARLAGQLHLDP